MCLFTIDRATDDPLFVSSLDYISLSFLGTCRFAKSSKHEVNKGRTRHTNKLIRGRALSDGLSLPSETLRLSIRACFAQTSPNYDILLNDYHFEELVQFSFKVTGKVRW